MSQTVSQSVSLLISQPDSHTVTQPLSQSVSLFLPLPLFTLKHIKPGNDILSFLHSLDRKTRNQEVLRTHGKIFLPCCTITMVHPLTHHTRYVLDTNWDDRSQNHNAVPLHLTLRMVQRKHHINLSDVVEVKKEPQGLNLFQKSVESCFTKKLVVNRTLAKLASEDLVRRSWVQIPPVGTLPKLLLKGEYPGGFGVLAALPTTGTP